MGSLDSPVPLTDEPSCLQPWLALDSCRFVVSHCKNEKSIVDYLQLYYCQFHTLSISWLFYVISIFVLLALFYLLYRVSDFFLSHALQQLALYMNLSDEIAGLTLLSFANGAPDFFTALAAANADGFGLIIGSALGSGTFAFTCILGCVILGSASFYSKVQAIRLTEKSRMQQARPLSSFATALAPKDSVNPAAPPESRCQVPDSTGVRTQLMPAVPFRTNLSVEFTTTYGEISHDSVRRKRFQESGKSVGNSLSAHNLPLGQAGQSMSMVPWFPNRRFQTITRNDLTISRHPELESDVHDTLGVNVTSLNANQMNTSASTSHPREFQHQNGAGFPQKNTSQTYPKNFKGFLVPKSSFLRGVWMYFVGLSVLGVIFLDGKISRAESIVMVVSYVLYITCVVSYHVLRNRQARFQIKRNRMQLNKKDRGLSADIPMRGSCRLANGTSSNRNFLRSSSQINEISPATGPVKKIDVRSAHSRVDILDIFPQDKLSSHQAADSLPSSNVFPSERYSASPELSLPLRQTSSGAINNRTLALECEHLPAHDAGRTQMLSTHLSPLEPEMVVSSAQERLEGNRLNSSEHAETPLIKPEYSDGSASIIVTSTEGVNSCIDLNQEDLDIQSMSPDGLKSRLNADLGSGDIQNSSLRNEAEMSLHPGFAFRSSSNGVISRKVSFSNDRDSGRTPKECDTKDSPRIIKHIPGSDCDSGTPPPFTSEEKPASTGNREDIKIQIQSKFPVNECPESKASKTIAGQEVDPMNGRLPPTLTLSLSCLQVQIPHTKSSAIMYHVETLILEPLRRKLALQRDSSWALRILSLIALPLNIALFLTVVPILREQVAEEEIINDEEEVEDEAVLQSARKICPKIPTDQHCNLPSVATSGNTPVLPPERVSVALQTNNTVTLQQLSSLAPNCRQARTESAIKRTNDLSVVSPDVLKFNLSNLPASVTSPSHSANIPSSPAIPISSLPLKNHGQELHGPSTQTSRLSFRGFGILRRANAVCTYQPSKSYVKFISILASLDNAIILRYRTLLLISPIILFSFTYSSLRWFTLPRILPQLPIWLVCMILGFSYGLFSMYISRFLYEVSDYYRLMLEEFTSTSEVIQGDRNTMERDKRSSKISRTRSDSTPLKVGNGNGGYHHNLSFNSLRVPSHSTPHRSIESISAIPIPSTLEKTVARFLRYQNELSNPSSQYYSKNHPHSIPPRIRRKSKLLYAVEFVHTFVSLSGCVIWVYAIANEIVSLLQTLGVLLGISQAFMGITILSWGNSVGDLFANSAMAKAGYFEVGITAVYTSPLQNILLTLGINFLRQSFASETGYIELPVFPASVYAAFACLIVSVVIVSGFVVPLVFKYRMPKSLGYGFLCVFGTYVVAIITMEIVLQGR